MAELQRTKPNRAWFLKMSAFFIVLFGFGVWGWWDANTVYPNRGRNAAEYYLLDYLRAAESANRLRIVDLVPDDPEAEFAELNEQARSRSLTPFELTRLQWLRSIRYLDVLTCLSPSVFGGITKAEVEARITEDPRARLRELDAEWKAKTPPKPLSRFDLPSQWAFVVIGWGGGLLVALHTARVLRRTYKWDPEAKRLYLPGGAELTPDDLEDVDKRKWHKYIVFLKVKEGHPKLAGQEVKLDLYQYAPLEDWVLEMERIAFPERALEKAAPEPPGDDEQGSRESDDSSDTE